MSSKGCTGRKGGPVCFLELLDVLPRIYSREDVNFMDSIVGTAVGGKFRSAPHTIGKFSGSAFFSRLWHGSTSVVGPVCVYGNAPETRFRDACPSRTKEVYPKYILN